MNAPERIDLPDLQSSPDDRGLALEAAGVKDLRYPLAIRSGGREVSTIATFSLTVALQAGARGTHMSRFVELIERQRQPLDLDGLRRLGQDMLVRLDAAAGDIVLRFPWFVRKAAPVSGVASLLDHDVEWRVHAARGQSRVSMAVTVAATSLCPCSKEISDYGAHNQRSHIRVEVELAPASGHRRDAPGARVQAGPREGHASPDLSIAELAAIAESGASCEVYGLLKRVDEKHVTERAYDTPRFDEDIVREVGVKLRADPRVAAWRVEAQNHESIHNHAAFARVAGRGAGSAEPQPPGLARSAGTNADTRGATTSARAGEVEVQR
jgi:GTP cyclohydrolase FolE2